MNRKAFKLAAALAVALPIATASYARDTSTWIEKVKDPASPVWVLDGSSVHNVGNLQMHVTNWGAIGSYPGSTFPTGEAPSAQWPANSGVEYLYIAGLWVGAKKNGIPVVSTAAYDIEFRPDPIDPLARIYRSFEGAAGGARYPSPPDDDKDGQINEDWLNGSDDDGDGKIDEDFAAIGKQMFACWFTDFDPSSIQANPEHTPLNLLVRQESYQWEEEKFYNFVGLEYKIKNVGTESIEDLYIGFFADGDAGPRTRGAYRLDDCTGYWRGYRLRRARRQHRADPRELRLFLDKDGDEGATGAISASSSSATAPTRSGKRSEDASPSPHTRTSRGISRTRNGGDPNNDFQHMSC